MNEYGAVENQMDGMIRDIEELRAENEKLKAENEKLKNYRVLVPKPIDHWGDGLLFVPEDFKQLYNDEEVEKIVKERDDHKHRAEVAERALMSISTNVIKDEKDDFAIEPRARVLYKAYLRQAEKELRRRWKNERL